MATKTTKTNGKITVSFEGFSAEEMERLEKLGMLLLSTSKDIIDAAAEFHDMTYMDEDDDSDSEDFIASSHMAYAFTPGVLDILKKRYSEHTTKCKPAMTTSETKADVTVSDCRLKDTCNFKTAKDTHSTADVDDIMDAFMSHDVIRACIPTDMLLVIAKHIVEHFYVYKASTTISLKGEAYLRCYPET